MRSIEVLDRPAAVRRSAATTSASGVLSVAGLFSGIGGIELGLARAGHRPVLMCEIDPVARAVLAARFPEVRVVSDVRELHAIGRADLLVAGFPCQDLSQAGPTRGLKGRKSALVFEALRLVADRRPKWLLLENVPFMLSLKRGHAIRRITSELTRMGYDWAYRVVDSRAFGLPQRRRRVFLLASRTEDPRHVLLGDDQEAPAWPVRGDAYGFYWTEGNTGHGIIADAVPPLKCGSALGIPSPPALLLSNGLVITPDIRDAERLQGFRSGWTESAADEGRWSDRWRLVGNAVSPPVCEWIGRRLLVPGIYRPGKIVKLASSGSWPTVGWSVGDGAFTDDIGEWPVRRLPPRIEDFLLHEGRPLSLKATSGFYGRASKSQLRFPPGFLKKLETHVRRMKAGEQ